MSLPDYISDILNGSLTLITGLRFVQPGAHHHGNSAGTNRGFFRMTYLTPIMSYLTPIVIEFCPLWANSLAARSSSIS
jgi:hypothetical protein